MKQRKQRAPMPAMEAFGYRLDENGCSVRIVQLVDTSAPGDYGADPLGDGTFRMVPSGDVVGFEERCERLKKRLGGAL